MRDPLPFRRFPRRDLGLFKTLLTRDLAPADILFAADSGLRQDQCLRHPRLFGLLTGGDLGLLDGALTIDLHALRFAIPLDSRLGEGLLLHDARALDRFARCDLRCFECARALDLTRGGLLLIEDAGFLDRTLLENPCRLDLFAGGDFLGFDRLRSSDLAPPDLDIRGDPRFGNAALVGDTRTLDSLARRDLRRFSLRFALGTLLGQQRPLLSATELDVAFLFEARLFARAIDFQRLLLGFEVAGADLDRCVLLDVIAQLTPGFNVLDEDGETLGIESVRRIEELETRLVDVENSDGLEFESVARQVDFHRLAYALDVDGAVLVHPAHVHRGSGSPHRAFELAGEQSVQALGFERSASKRRGSHRDCGALGLNAHIEFRFDVDAHPVLGDQRLAGDARHLERQGVHVDRRDLMDHRPNERAAVDDDFFTEEPSPDERDLLGGAAVEPLQNPEDDGDHHHRYDEPEDQLADHFSGNGHVRSSLAYSLGGYWPPRPWRAMRLNMRVCSVRAISVGRRSIDDAP